MRWNEAIALTDMSCQVFRIHRDIRFSKDPTPYKVSIIFKLDLSTCRVSRAHVQIVGGLTIAMTRRTFQLHGRFILWSCARDSLP